MCIAKRTSGRSESEPDLKLRLHARLALRGITLTDWFVRVATEFVGHSGVDEVPGAGREQAQDIDIPAVDEV
jgi:hypothetical protein